MFCRQVHANTSPIQRRKSLDASRRRPRRGIISFPFTAKFPLQRYASKPQSGRRLPAGLQRETRTALQPIQQMGLPSPDWSKPMESTTIARCHRERRAPRQHPCRLCGAVQTRGPPGDERDASPERTAADVGSAEQLIAVSSEGLQAIDGDDDIPTAMARELVENKGIGESADSVWRALGQLRPPMSASSREEPENAAVHQPGDTIPGMLPLTAEVTSSAAIANAELMPDRPLSKSNEHGQLSLF